MMVIKKKLKAKDYVEPVLIGIVEVLSEGQERELEKVGLPPQRKPLPPDTTKRVPVYP